MSFVTILNLRQNMSQLVQIKFCVVYALACLFSCGKG